jgi:hypothetical protein
LSRFLTAQATPNVLVSNIEGAGDPSIGLNPVKVRTGFVRQNMPEVSREGGVYTRIFEYGRTFDRRSPGVHTLQGRLTGSYVRASADVTVTDNTFTSAATLFVGEYSFTSGVDFSVATATQATGSFTVTASPSTATLTIGGVNLTPAGGGRTPGANNYNNTLGTVNAIAAEIAAAINDLANGFDGFISAVAMGPNIALTAIPLGALGNVIGTSSNNGTVVASGATLTGGIDAVDNTSTNIAAAINGIGGYEAAAVGPTITVTAPFGPNGNNVFVDAEYTGTVQNFTVVPGTWYMAGGQPYVGPPSILP